MQHTMMKLSRNPKPTNGRAAARATEAHMLRVGDSVLPAFAVAVNCRSSCSALMNSSLYAVTICICILLYTAYNVGRGAAYLSSC